MADTRLVDGRAAGWRLAAAEPQAMVPADSANATAEMVKILEILVPRMPSETGDYPFWLRYCSRLCARGWRTRGVFGRPVRMTGVTMVIPDGQRKPSNPPGLVPERGNLAGQLPWR
jgi:hypothetical protein